MYFYCFFFQSIQKMSHINDHIIDYQGFTSTDTTCGLKTTRSFSHHIGRQLLSFISQGFCRKIIHLQEEPHSEGCTQSFFVCLYEINCLLQGFNTSPKLQNLEQQPLGMVSCVIMNLHTHCLQPMKKVSRMWTKSNRKSTILDQRQHSGVLHTYLIKLNITKYQL